MPDDLVTIRRFEFLHEAEAARICLEAEGTRAFLADAETVNMDWGLGNALGYIKLQVPSSQTGWASAILTEFQNARTARPATSDDAGACLACGADIPIASPQCPTCGWSYADAEDQSSEETAPSEYEPHIGQTATVSITDRFKSFKRPMLLVFLAPTFLGIGFLGIFIIVSIIRFIIG